MSLSRYKFVVREAPIKHLKGNNSLEDRRIVIIGVIDKKTGIVIPHPITNFIKSQYEYYGLEINTQKDVARTIMMFFNFIYEQIELGNKKFHDLTYYGISGLNLVHGSAFITSQTEKGLIKKTVLRRERNLTHFYKYLSDLNILKGITFYSQLKRDGEEFIVSPFREASLETQYPFGTQPNVIQLKNFPNRSSEGIDMVREFIETAREIFPEIAFGIAMQIYSGLRRGEVVNLTKSSFPVDFIDHQIFVLVRDNQNTLFPHIQDSDTGQVKNPRLQMVLPSYYLKELYMEHKKSRNYFKSDNPDAFFTNKDGTTMTGEAYTKNFSKVKWAYIDKLGSTPGRYSDFKLLSESAWGTHIGRRIFTNTLADMGFSEKQLAMARGDKSTQSAAVYLDALNAARNFEDAVNKIATTDDLELASFVKNKMSQGVY